jgi:hypothetical protein
MSSDDEAPMIDADPDLGTGSADNAPALGSATRPQDDEDGSDDGREVNFESDDEHKVKASQVRSGSREKRAKTSPGGPSKPSKRQNEEREARDEFVKRLVHDMQVALQRDNLSRQERRPALEMLKLLPRVCEAVANPLLFNYWRDDPNHMNLLADWIAPQSRSVNLPLLSKLVPAIEQLPLEKDVCMPHAFFQTFDDILQQDITDYHRLPKSLSNVEALVSHNCQLLPSFFFYSQ